ncbi:MAG: hypothetical protein JW829_19095, partial [Pirellulales bacterium]|nr:hypothetical protein [Pirellulales bacterium]
MESHHVGDDDGGPCHDGRMDAMFIAGFDVRARAKLQADHPVFGLGKPESLATSPARPIFRIGCQPRAARPFAPLTSACP